MLSGKSYHTQRPGWYIESRNKPPLRKKSYCENTMQKWKQFRELYRLSFITGEYIGKIYITPTFFLSSRPGTLREKCAFEEEVTWLWRYNVKMKAVQRTLPSSSWFWCSKTKMTNKQFLEKSSAWCTTRLVSWKHLSVKDIRCLYETTFFNLRLDTNISKKPDTQKDRVSPEKWPLKFIQKPHFGGTLSNIRTRDSSMRGQRPWKTLINFLKLLLWKSKQLKYLNLWIPNLVR